MWGVALGVVLSLTAACTTRGSAPAPASSLEPSPNASILPAPLVSGAVALPPKLGARTLPAKSSDVESEPPTPAPLDERTPVASDKLQPRELGLSALVARFQWQDSATARSELGRWAKSHAEFSLSIDVSPTRLRIALDSDAFVLPRGSELRSRPDLQGHLLIWPDLGSYRALPQGTLRALFAERRVDVGPVVTPKIETLEGAHYLVGPVERTKLTTPTGELLIEQGITPAPGFGGMLLCRFLLEFVLAPAETPVCEPERLPLRATFLWPGGKTFTFRVLTLTQKPEATLENLLTPPEGARQVVGELPAAAGVILPEELQAQIRPTPVGLESPEIKTGGVPPEGILLDNRETAVRYAVIGGVPVAWAAARTSVLLKDLKPGRHSLMVSDFFGAEQQVAQLVAPALWLVGTRPNQSGEIEGGE